MDIRNPRLHNPSGDQNLSYSHLQGVHGRQRPQDDDPAGADERGRGADAERHKSCQRSDLFRLGRAGRWRWGVRARRSRQRRYEVLAEPVQAHHSTQPAQPGLKVSPDGLYVEGLQYPLISSGSLLMKFMSAVDALRMLLKCRHRGWNPSEDSSTSSALMIGSCADHEAWKPITLCVWVNCALMVNQNAHLL